jgi:pimeloyl-ACP methyl ester carboxylesterase
MAALARAGYLVVAPDHADALSRAGGTPGRPELFFRKPEQWSEATYQDRARDITSVVAALKANERFTRRVDWSRLALAGHSLGGYTALGVAGGWPGWKLADVRAVLALSPYANPFLHHGDLAGLGCAVMYQSGTLDIGVAPFVIRPGGIYDKTGSPAYLVELRGAGHLAWTDLNPRFHAVIIDYSVAFLDRYLKGDKAADPGQRRSAVADLRVK